MERQPCFPFGRLISTRYGVPSEHRGPRVIARHGDQRLIIPWDHRLDHGGNHRAAAIALVTRLRGLGFLVGRSIIGAPSLDGWAWIVCDAADVEALP